jgi:hypothetical protein
MTIAPTARMAHTTLLTACTADLSCSANSGSPHVPPTAQYRWIDRQTSVNANAR